MQQTDPAHDQHEATYRTLRRLLYLACAALVVLLLVLLPPLISVNRYQHRIAASIAASLDRPVHLDKVTLNLLPLPGFTLENFVVDEDPAFGSEPVIRANSVRVTLRLTSLWRRRVEFSTISLTEPSVNLVHTSNGKWNLDTILLHAAHIDAAPTAQRSAGPAPRFPYIEATGARLNLKLDNEKTPISLTDADFALWLPDPRLWHLRLQAHPARTDANVSDTGILQVEGTLGRAASLEEVPLSLRGTWTNAPLGAATLLLLGRDAGLRGTLDLSANVQGTVGHSGLQTSLRLTDTRRADFVPAQPLNLEVQCLGTATSAFFSFQDIHCSWPPAGSSQAPMLNLTAELPDIRHRSSLSLQIASPGLPAATLLEWFRVASSRVPPDLSASGTLTGNLSYGAPHRDPASANPGALPNAGPHNLHTPASRSPLLAETSSLAPAPRWQGQMLLSNARLINPAAGSASLVEGDISLHTLAPAPTPAAHPKHAPAIAAPGPSTANQFLLDPVTLALGGKDPAILDGRFDPHGYTLHLSGLASIARLMAFTSAIPPLKDNLADVLPTNRAPGAFRIDLTATHTWGSPQVWTDNSASPAAAHPRRLAPPSAHPPQTVPYR